MVRLVELFFDFLCKVGFHEWDTIAFHMIDPASYYVKEKCVRCEKEKESVVQNYDL